VYSATPESTGHSGEHGALLLRGKGTVLADSPHADDAVDAVFDQCIHHFLSRTDIEALITPELGGRRRKHALPLLHEFSKVGSR
jgi:hypothetical protein